MSNFWAKWVCFIQRCVAKQTKNNCLALIKNLQGAGQPVRLQENLSLATRSNTNSTVLYMHPNIVGSFTTTQALKTKALISLLENQKRLHSVNQEQSYTNHPAIFYNLRKL